MRFHALLTLSSKFFSTFPHGTCLLSVSRSYLALTGVYLPFGLYFQTTRLSRGSDRTASAAAWASHPLRAVVPLKGNSSSQHRPEGLSYTPQFTLAVRLTDSALGFSLFTRRYSGNHFCFLFLRLLICLSSAGNHA